MYLINKRQIISKTDKVKIKENEGSFVSCKKINQLTGDCIVLEYDNVSKSFVVCFYTKKNCKNSFYVFSLVDDSPQIKILSSFSINKKLGLILPKT